MARKIDMNFIGYTYKADVENEKSMLVNVLKDLDTITESQAQNQQNQSVIQNNKAYQNNGGSSFRDMSRSSSDQ